MRIDFSSKCVFAANIMIGSINAYKTAHHFEWLAAYAVGILAGFCMSRVDLSNIKESYKLSSLAQEMSDTDEDMKKEDKKIKLKRIVDLVTKTKFFRDISICINAVTLLIFTRAAKLLEKESISKTTAFASGFTLGLSQGYLINLLNLSKETDPIITNITDKIFV